MKKPLKFGLYGLLTLVAASAALGLSACAAMGSSAKGARLERMEASPQWSDGRFVNRRENVTEMSGGAESSDYQSPAKPITVLKRKKSDYSKPPISGLRVTWLGHSTMLLEVDGARILTDPLWSKRVSPISFIGPKRWYEPPLPLSELPDIDVVLISHDHYDHLDHKTVVALRDRKEMKWVVPLGVGAHLEGWGIEPKSIVELDWWESHKTSGLTLTATPARHFSGRAIPNPNGGPTLWAGWSIAGAKNRVYFSGDTGFFDELVEIGEKLGPFDLTLMESGAYSHSARDIHLGPEQAVRAHELVRGKVMLPVHWGLYDLNAHGWTEPIERVLAAAKERNVQALSIQPGEMVEPASPPAPKRWWPEVPWNDAKADPITSTGTEKLFRSK